MRHERVLISLAGLALIWHTPFLPLLDLPQHLAQITLLRDLWLGQSPFARDIWVNWTTPYLLFYLPTTALALLLGPVLATQVFLSLAYLGFLWAGARLLQHVQAQPILFWLLPAAFFGFCWNYGFITFLAAAPLLFLFLIAADKASRAPSWRTGAGVGLFALVLFYSHMLICALALLICAGLLLARHWRAPLRAFPVGVPILVALSGPLALYLTTHAANPQISDTQVLNPPYDLLERLLFLFVHQGPPEQIASVILAILLSFAVLGLGGWQRSALLARVSMAVLAILWLALPFTLAGTAYVFNRYAVFFWPFLALLFTTVATPTAHTRLCQMALRVCVLALLLVQAVVQVEFSRQMRDFIQVSTTIPVGARVLNLQDEQLLTGSGYAALHVPAWLTPLRGAWVDFSFAVFSPQMVRLHERLPPVLHSRQIVLQNFNWQEYQAQRYDYLIVRASVPAALAAPPPCHLHRVAQAGVWSVFQVQSCARP